MPSGQTDAIVEDLAICNTMDRMPAYRSCMTAPNPAFRQSKERAQVGVQPFVPDRSANDFRVVRDQRLADWSRLRADRRETHALSFERTLKSRCSAFRPKTGSGTK